MPASHPSDFKRNLRKEIAGYFLVALVALPLHFALWMGVIDEGNLAENIGHKMVVYSLVPMIGAIVFSKLRLRYKLALIFVLVVL